MSNPSEYLPRRLKLSDVARLLVEHQRCTKKEARDRLKHAVYRRSLEIIATLDTESREVETDITAWHDIDWESGIVKIELSSAGSPPVHVPVVPLFGREDVLECFDLALAPESAVRQRRGGRPTQHDWDAFWIEVCRRVHEQGLPEIRKRLVEEMLDWFADRGDESIDERTVAKKISKLCKEIGLK